MAVFAIILDEDTPNDWDELKRNFPSDDYFVLTERVAFVDSVKPSLKTAELSGVSPDNPGMAIHIRRIDGWNDPAVWEWIEDRR